MVLNKTAELVGETDALLGTLAKIDETGSLFERLKQDQGKITLTWEEVKTMVADRVGGGLKSLMREVFGSEKKPSSGDGGQSSSRSTRSNKSSASRKGGLKKSSK